MSSYELLREGRHILVDDSETKQIQSMEELLGGRGVFDLLKAPRGYSLSVRGYAGMLSFRDGKTVIIVPEIKSVVTDEGTAHTFMEMLYTVFGISTVGTLAENLFEFFIRGFVDAVSKLTVRGLRSKYHLVSGNEKSVKGKIVFNEHIRQNYIHKERIFVEYEYYSQNRPENRLIKTTMEALSRRSKDSHNIKALKNLIAQMEEIPSTTDVDKDMSMVVMDRNMIDYVTPMFWCNVFLRGMGLAGASKENLSFALMVDTDSLFRAYVAKMAAMEREDGMYKLSYDAEILKEGDAKGVSYIDLKLDWNYYDRANDVNIKDAESLYMTTPGYRVIPRSGDNRIRAMAGSYLADTLA